MGKNFKIKKVKYPHNCEECEDCLYICEGDFICSRADFSPTVKEDWLPTEYYDQCEKCMAYVPEV